MPFVVFEGIGPKHFFLLRKYFGSASKIWFASHEKLQETGLSAKLVTRFVEFRTNFNLSSYYLGVKKRLIKIIIFDDKDYPELLKEIAIPPILLLVKGEILPQDVNAIAVVGTRKITPYGRQVTQRLVRGLVSHNITIVSGLARGVDSVAHRTALEFGGRTLAVLGSGLDVIYPPENRNLAFQIAQNGALISEFPLEAAPEARHFPQRNRIISGLSLGVVVTEGASRSGTKITANFAVEQNREVFAVAGNIDSPMSEGPADLIKMGAKIVTRVEDILEEVRLKKIKVEKVDKVGKVEKDGLSQDERKILEVLKGGQQHIDQITRKAGLKAALVSSTLTLLEVKGRVKNIGGGRYCLVG